MSVSTNTANGGLSWIKDVTRYQWLVFLVAWFGWMLDATDFGLFNLVLRPALTELLGGNPTIAQIGQAGEHRDQDNAQHKCPDPADVIADDAEGEAAQSPPQQASHAQEPT